MRLGTISLVSAAAVCAAAAAFLTKSWLSGQPQQAPIIAGAPAAAATQTVVVAAKPLSFGTVLEPEILEEVRWPAGSTPDGFFSSKDALLSAGGQRVVLSAIAKNEPILRSKVTAPGQRASLSVVIGQGMKAVTIRVDDVLGVAGFVQPDDRVDVLLTRQEKNGKGEKAAAAPFTDVLLQNVRVLAIDQFADRNASAKPAKAVTVEVATADAQKLVLAATVGQLSLALRRAGYAGTSETGRIGMQDLPSTAASDEPQAVAREGAPAPAKPVVTVTRATDRKQYEVEADPGGHAVEPQGEPGEATEGGVDEDPVTKSVFLGAGGPDDDTELNPEAQGPAALPIPQ